ncbi:hypothetical protein [Sulfitobacter sp.]|uniref:hypothetical protein n=1 Tax=Sulfitobacter sp. TaxID=1903071 RepID=UPI0030016E7D
MNRRQFNASLGAFGTAATLPMAAMPSAAVAAPAVSTSTYKWAQLIVGAQAKADPAMLSRLLRLSPEIAPGVFDKLIRDGVLRTPGVAGVARAVQPVRAIGQSVTGPTDLRRQLRAVWNNATEDAQPLVIEDDPALGCGNTAEKEKPDASTTEPLQESSRRGRNAIRLLVGAGRHLFRRDDGPSRF